VLKVEEIKRFKENHNTSSTEFSHHQDHHTCLPLL
jgi:hypothetical protein